ncbi:hypothetical protein MJG53_004211 [Ovis ammon polii x Ovis aries]|uniref:Uncharacterized protein n=1 Tax=Ovis ammon polii x Ovis aries TaxID=2918886 RepID=A0ACB9V9L5_9CETA|nr:hypothetical protein MJG53_004211 [Ovis ammon polii x Ovis aries]
MDRSSRAGAIRALPGAVSLLLLMLLVVHSPPSQGLKYGIRAVGLKSIETVLESGFFSRISSWRNSTVGGHPWQVSLKLGGHHFCGGSLIQDDLVVTAVHCLISLNEKQIKSLTVTAGEYNLFQKDKEEQNSPVSKIIIHPEYNRLGYMSFNIALLYLKLKVKFDSLNKIGSTSFPKTNPISSAKVIPYGVCGIPPFSPQWLSRRIAGGVEACPHCWPWQVGLRFLGNHHCGGAIINSIWILTAAHCVHSKNNPLFWTIVAGDHDRTLKESTEQVRRAKHIVMHEDFDTLSYDSDIALIQLSSALEFNSVVRPICLPHSLEPLFSSEICVVTGWGSVSKDGGLASRLQQIQVPVLEREVCEHTYYSAHPGGISEKMICAGFAASGGKDVGQGDSGGPLVCKHEKGPFVLYGIVSWGAGCAQPRKPGVFARVSVFLDWIQSKIKGCYPEVELEEPRGFFSSPRYPLDYRGKLECSWVLRVSPRSMAKFTVEYLLLPGSRMCQDSALIIYEENHSERRMSGKLCGRRLYPMVFMSSGPLVRVTFHSGVQGAFGINYIVFRVQGPKGSKSTQSLQSSNQEHVATCEDGILTKPAGIIQFPRYFHRTIKSCHWRLLAPINHIIRLDIINFQKQPMPLACQGHLWVYEGFGSGKKLIGSMRGNIKVNGKEDKGAHLCGSKKEFVWISSGAYLTVNLKTDESVGERGFKLILEDMTEKPSQKSNIGTQLPINGEFVSTICLPGKDDKINLLSKCLTAGWGITEPHQDEFPKTVQQAKVPLISSISCRSYWGLEIKNTNICGGASGSSSCMGDSGGPLQCGEGGQYKLIGIVSWGSSNCHPAAPTVFTRISAYTDWITSITGGEAGSLEGRPDGTVITSGKGNT